MLDQIGGDVRAKKFFTWFVISYFLCFVGYIAVIWAVYGDVIPYISRDDAWFRGFLVFSTIFSTVYAGYASTK
jgi:hypothetical protein